MRCKKNFNLPVSLAMRAAIEQLKQKPISFGSSIETRQYLRLQLEQLEREVFVVLFLDNQHRLIANETTSLGTINATSVYPREIVKAVLSHNAAAVILAHNHPSGLAEPRNADRLVTERLKDALSLIDVRILDHVVVGQGESMSFAEQGWLWEQAHADYGVTFSCNTRMSYLFSFQPRICQGQVSLWEALDQEIFSGVEQYLQLAAQSYFQLF